MLENYLKAFKAYDIRGIYPEQIDEKSTYIMGKAMGKYMSKNFGKDSKILIGTDTRDANNTLILYFINGMQNVGFENINIANFKPEIQHPSKENKRGICSSQYIYYMVQNDFDIGVVFTASHNTKEYTGMKFIDKNVVFVDTKKLREMFVDEYQKTDLDNISINNEIFLENKEQRLIQEKRNKLNDFLLNKFENLSKKYNFSVDFCHGAGVSCERDFFANYLSENHNIKFIHDHPDGDFPVHDSETQKPNNYKWLVEDILENNRDFGIMFDGDVDRIGIVTNKGRIIPGDILTAVISEEILEEEFEKKPKIMYDVMSGKIIEDIVKEKGAIPMKTRMGRYFINREMLKENAIFAGECSGHFMFGEHGSYELPILAMYYIMKGAEKFESFDKMYQRYNKYHSSGVLDKIVKDKDKVLEKVSEYYKSHNPLNIDGVNIYNDDFQITVRKSNTSDKIRYSIQTNNLDLLEKLMKELEIIINE